METELIGEFKGKNTVYRVLPDGKRRYQGKVMVKFWVSRLSWQPIAPVLWKTEFIVAKSTHH
jgi:hypothetical protein